jgi:hypothetical protein
VAHTSRDGAHGHQEHGKVARADDSGTGRYGITNRGHQHETDDMDRSVLRFGRAEGHTHGKEKGSKLQDSAGQPRSTDDKG